MWADTHTHTQREKDRGRARDAFGGRNAQQKFSSKALGTNKGKIKRENGEGESQKNNNNKPEKANNMQSAIMQ